MVTVVMQGEIKIWHAIYKVQGRTYAIKGGLGEVGRLMNYSRALGGSKLLQMRDLAVQTLKVGGLPHPPPERKCKGFNYWQIFAPNCVKLLNFDCIEIFYETMAFISDMNIKASISFHFFRRV